MFRSFWTRWLSDEDGVTAAEYAVMLALILLAIISSITAVGNTTAAGWQNNAEKITSACASS